MKADFVNVQKYTLNYGHDGIHIEVIRTRFDYKEISNISFILLEINLFESKTETFNISSEDVTELFEKHYPELPKRIVNDFINGCLEI